MTFIINNLSTEITLGDSKHITLEAKDINVGASIKDLKDRLKGDGWSYVMPKGETHSATLYDIAKFIDKYDSVLGVPSILNEVTGKNLKKDKTSKTDALDTVLKDIQLTITDFSLTVSTSKPSFKFGIKVKLDKSFYKDITDDPEAQKLFGLLKVDEIGIVFSYSKSDDVNTVIAEAEAVVTEVNTAVTAVKDKESLEVALSKANDAVIKSKTAASQVQTSTQKVDATNLAAAAIKASTAAQKAAQAEKIKNTLESLTTAAATAADEATTAADKVTTATEKSSLEDISKTIDRLNTDATKALASANAAQETANNMTAPAKKS